MVMVKNIYISSDTSKEKDKRFFYQLLMSSCLAMVELDTAAVMGAKMLPICHGVAAGVSGDQGFYGSAHWVERKGALAERPGKRDREKKKERNVGEREFEAHGGGGEGDRILEKTENGRKGCTEEEREKLEERRRETGEKIPELHDKTIFPGDRFKLILQISIHNLRLL